MRLDTLASAGLGLAILCASTNVLRILVLSIVLALAVGQNASLLCAIWCHPAAGPIGPCEHQGPSTSPSVAGNHGCPVVAGPATAFVREDVRREGLAADAMYAVAVPPFRFAPPPQSAFACKPDHGPALDTRPLVLALRI